MSEKRRYELRARAERLEETRRRIIEATVGLHLEVGPAATTISEIARRAGVGRVTVYSHFPDEASLFGACSAHWRAQHPAPDPSAWAGIAYHGERLRAALGALYAWYRETEPLTANVLRDAESLPALKAIIDAGLARYLEAVVGLLTKPFRARGRRRARIEAAARAAVGFHLWRALAPLPDAERADVAAGMVERAAR